ncbi:chemotaxis protein CheA [bacterium BMS3Bbin12]|nr:chemotaxis protein CheA [bacterium BMS3Bbin12]GBE50455.1 chemotaxis protein CheA [bacterium BMS3Bbin13]
MVGEAIERLPELIGELRGGEACAAIEVVALMERAAALTRGEAAAEEEAHKGSAAEAASVPDAGADSALEADSEPPSEEEPAPEPTPAPDTGDIAGREEPDAATGEALRIADPVLYETFSQEVHDHLATIDDFVARCDGQEDSGCRITEELVRAFHTLYGSAHMAGVPEIAEVAGSLEKLARLPAVAGAAHDLALAPLFSDAAALMRAQLATLAQPGIAMPDHGSLLERIERVVDAHLSRIGGLPGPGAVTESGTVTESGIGTGTDEETKAEPPPGPPSEGPPIGPSAAAPAPSAEPVPETRDELADELAEIFLEEAEELLEAADETLESWEQHPEEVRRVTELQRELHTLKGGARMADIGAMADLSHAMESLLSATIDGHVEASQELFQTLHVTLDQFHSMHEALRAGAVPAPAPKLVAELEAARTGRDVPSAHAAATDDPETTVAAQPDGEPPSEADVGSVVAPPAAGVEEKAEAEGLEEGSEGPAPAVQPALRIERRGVPRVQSETVRVKADLLDSLVNYAGEISIYRSRMEQQTAAIRFNLVEFDQTVARLREQLRRLEIETEAQILYRHEVEAESREDFDPLELDRYSNVQQLSRGLAESVSDLVSIQGLLDHLSRESETLLLQQSRVNTEMQDGLMHTRMVPFAGLIPRLRRIVRQTCAPLGKRAELKVEGAEGEMDRAVLDRLVASMEHMLRNAISHGIEVPEVRRVSGKPETGTILLGLSREGSEVVIRVCDDGAGIDLDAIRRKAVERGMLAVGAEVSDHNVMQFILESGFSTARTLTQISGRGVGMDVVNSEIKQLGGQFEIDSRVGRGTTFTIRLPFTLAVTHALLVQVGEERYAIPLSSVEGIVRLGYDEVSRRLGEETPVLEYAGQPYRLAHLGALLGISTTPTIADRKVPVLLVRSGGHQSALLVDRLLGSREIVVKSVGPQLSMVRGISGATILGDGRVVLIVDAGALVRLSAALRSAPPVKVEAEPEPSGRVTVMVVDDSITVRKVTARLLERNGMDVLTAKDGVDAVALLQEHVPDIMLLDIEMPRMDGFELATHMRNESRLREIPIIMITSRTGEKHREHALRIGVNRYLGKPYQEGELIENLHALLNERAGHGGS